MNFLKALFLSLNCLLVFFHSLPLFAKDIVGAGSSFCYPLYKKMFHFYKKKTHEPVNYQAIGSGGGERQLKNKIVSFCATETPSLQGNQFLLIPSCMAPIAISYHLPGNPQIRLTPQILADIYLGKIKKWNHPRLTKINPKLKLPEMSIVVLHRADSSGTSKIFSYFLSKTSPEWQKNVGSGMSLSWPVGIGASKNMGIANYIKQIPGTIGYLAYSYSSSSNLPSASIQNEKKIFVNPSIFFSKKGSHLSFSSYPIIIITWLITYKEQSQLKFNKNDFKKLYNLFLWMIDEVNSFSKELLYLPLSSQLLLQAKTSLALMTYHGKKISILPTKTS